MRTLTYSLSYYNQGKEAIMKHLNMWKEYPKEKERETVNGEQIM